MKRILQIVILPLLLSGIVRCQGVSKVGTSAAPFLEIGVGSRATALAGAYTAIADGPESMYWNPAGIDWFSKDAVSFNYSNWFAGEKFLYAAGVLHLGSVGSFGASVTSLSTPYMLVTTVDYPDGVGQQFDAADIALGVTYARKLMERFSFGATFKYIDRRIWEMNANAMAVDFGILYQLPWQNIKLGMSILNFGSQLQMQGVDAVVTHQLDPTITGSNSQILASLYTREWNLPLSLKVGLSYQVLKNRYNEILLAADFVHPNDNYSFSDVGAEYGFMDHVFLRVGYEQLGLVDSQVGLTWGAGLKFASLGVDYSYIKTKYLGFVDQFTVDLEF